MEDLQAIMKEGKLPLLDVELTSAQQFRSSKIDCLTVFLNPASIDEYHTRLVQHLTETERAISAYVLEAKRQMVHVTEAKFFNEIITNNKANATTEAILDIAKKYRPDIFKNVSTGMLQFSLLLI